MLSLTVSTRWRAISSPMHGRRILGAALLLAQLWALLVVPMHSIAHAPQFAVAAAAASSPTDADSSLDLYGHAAGHGCSDWNAAFFVDANPAAASARVGIAETVCTNLPDFSTRLARSGKTGFFLARAPPRA